MNPLRWEVLAFALVLAVPVLAMGVRGDLTVDEVVVRLPWCLAAAWAALAILHAFTRPEKPHKRPTAHTAHTTHTTHATEEDTAA